MKEILKYLDGAWQYRFLDNLLRPTASVYSEKDLEKYNKTIQAIMDEINDKRNE